MMDQNSRVLPKKPYETPCLRVYGDVKKLTLTGTHRATARDARTYRT